MKNLAIILTFTILFVSCSKKDDEPQIPIDQLPAITTIGANTAGCLVNGQILIPKNGINGISGFPVYGLRTYAGPNFSSPQFNDYYAIDIINLQNKGLNYSVYVHLNNLALGAINYTVGQSNGEYFIDGPINPHIIAQEFYNNTFTGKLFISIASSGNINITCFDYANHIISGTFNCTLQNKVNPSETIQISDGRFDINTLTLNK